MKKRRRDEKVPYECRNNEAFGAGTQPLAVKSLGLAVKPLPRPLSHPSRYHPPFPSLFVYCNLQWLFASFDWFTTCQKKNKTMENRREGIGDQQFPDLCTTTNLHNRPWQYNNLKPSTFSLWFYFLFCRNTFLLILVTTFNLNCYYPWKVKFQHSSLNYFQRELLLLLNAM